MKEKLNETVRDIMASVFALSPDEIPAQASVSSVRQWDSLAHLMLVLALEEEFGVEFDEQEIVTMTDLEAIARTLGARLGFG